jgi:hypothetical protein
MGLLASAKALFGLLTRWIEWRIVSYELLILTSIEGLEDEIASLSVNPCPSDLLTIRELQSRRQARLELLRHVRASGAHS